MNTLGNTGGLQEEHKTSGRGQVENNVNSQQNRFHRMTSLQQHPRRDALKPERLRLTGVPPSSCEGGVRVQLTGSSVDDQGCIRRDESGKDSSLPLEPDRVANSLVYVIVFQM
ncbi:hypothetical protein EYF80_060033 [Liparis tanakae]|uniref:Uncharacterized protein n=1 Tax=Liparis tanakae TaxID=230148 RepID=A0A4Z2EM43_9TELE|nr:hypothetical protein EYF80_060033 [Liparis tanakae]